MVKRKYAIILKEKLIYAVEEYPIKVTKLKA